MQQQNSVENMKDFAKDTSNISLERLEGILKKYELENIHADFTEKIALLVIAALGIITAVAWDQVLKLVAQYLFDGVSDNWAKVSYAVMVTVITVIVSIIVNKIFAKKRHNLFKKNIVELLKSDVLK